ncbi:MAG TPA: hypothetical protein VE197_06045, partial [Mycobacterium sp.]|nr:hypothetical protein [Mycobacterium sp.]
ERSGRASRERPALLDTAGLDRLVTVLIERGYRVIGPTVRTATLIPLLRRDGMSEDAVDRVFSTFNVANFATERSKQ